MDICDSIVIGAGPAGDVVASPLGDVPFIRMLRREAGGWDITSNIHISALPRKVAANSNWGRQFPVWSGPSHDNSQDHRRAGRNAGGGSWINDMVRIRGCTAEFDDWFQAGATGRSCDNVPPYFRKAERPTLGADSWHGNEGPLRVDDTRTHRKVENQFAQTAVNVGSPANADCNGRTRHGIGGSRVSQTGSLHVADASIMPTLASDNTKATATMAGEKSG